MADLQTKGKIRIFQAESCVSAGLQGLGTVCAVAGTAVSPRGTGEHSTRWHGSKLSLWAVQQWERKAEIALAF